MLEEFFVEAPSRASLTRRLALEACSQELHAPDGSGRIDNAGVRRALCRTCGCQLVKSGVSRWYRSGLMG